MEYRQLGRSGLRVSTLALGTMTFGGRGTFAKTGAGDVAQATRLLDRCLDAGVNLIDTADVYSSGLSEEILGEAMQGRRGRPGVVSLIVGARTEAQLDDNLGAAGMVLPDTERARIDTVSAPPLLYPYWHQAAAAHDRLSAADLSLLAPHLKR